MMKAFIQKTLVFLIPILLVWGGLEYFYRATASNYSYKHQTITENYKDIETLILGDSHALYGINPQYIDAKAFNLANISQSLYFDELLFKKHIDSLNNLKQLILTISYFSLSKLENSEESTWRKYFYSNLMDVDVPVISRFDVREYSLSLARRFRASVEFIKYYYENGESLVGCDSNGWGTLYETTTGVSLDKESWSTAKRHEDFLMDFEENITRLQSIIEYCKKIKCKVYLVDMPVYHSYISLLNPDKFQKITNSCNKLAQDNVNVTYINLRQDFRLEDSDFYDPDHLNHKGAKKYTEIINQIISDSKNDD
ncbi:hypothetical protein [uncultured Aquimarina sp.]|uniref:hypothetical protein n=1 Tax=uncultured Aquimarina sp. TaxID=575652 RepID=UPI00261CA209|nr:hypothetical protein [uncultured Aquimarina sp.]